MFTLAAVAKGMMFMANGWRWRQMSGQFFQAAFFCSRQDDKHAKKIFHSFFLCVLAREMSFSESANSAEGCILEQLFMKLPEPYQPVLGANSNESE